MKKIILLLFIAISGNIFAQATPDSLIAEFFVNYSKDAPEAVKDLYRTNNWFEDINDIKGVEGLLKSVAKLQEGDLGEYYGYELILTKKVTKVFELHSYLLKYHRQPIRFTFQFYKPNDKWGLYAFSLDYKISTELKKSAKLYNTDSEGE